VDEVELTLADIERNLKHAAADLANLLGASPENVSPSSTVDTDNLSSRAACDLISPPGNLDYDGKGLQAHSLVLDIIDRPELLMDNPSLEAFYTPKGSPADRYSTASENMPAKGPQTEIVIGSNTPPRNESGKKSPGSRSRTGSPDKGVGEDMTPHLFWVPAHQHPEVAPLAFKEWLDRHDMQLTNNAVQRVRRRKSYRESANVVSVHKDETGYAQVVVSPIDLETNLDDPQVSPLSAVRRDGLFPMICIFILFCF
jgi:hypothetical protein